MVPQWRMRQRPSSDCDCDCDCDEESVTESGCGDGFGVENGSESANDVVGCESGFGFGYYDVGNDSGSDDEVSGCGCGCGDVGNDCAHGSRKIALVRHLQHGAQSGLKTWRRGDYVGISEDEETMQA